MVAVSQALVDGLIGVHPVAWTVSR
jgi:hypothetical protein